MLWIKAASRMVLEVLIVSFILMEMRKSVHHIIILDLLYFTPPRYKLKYLSYPGSLTNVGNMNKKVRDR